MTTTEATAKKAGPRAHKIIALLKLEIYEAERELVDLILDSDDTAYSNDVLVARRRVIERRARLDAALG